MYLATQCPSPIPLARPFRTGLLAAAGALTAYSLWLTLGTLAPVAWSLALAAFLAIGLSPLVRLLQSWDFPRPASLAVTYSLVILTLACVLLLVVPPVVDQTTQMLARAEAFVDEGGVDSFAATLQQFVPIAVLDVSALLDGLTSGAASGATMQNVSGGVLGAGAAMGYGLFLTSVVLVMTMYFLASGRWFGGQLVAALPPEHRVTGRRILQRCTETVGRYFAGQLLLASLHGVLSLILLLATGSALSLLFAAVALVCALIPLIGIPLGAAIVVGGKAVINPGGTTTLLVLCAWYLLYMAVEAYLIAPRVVGLSVAMPTVMVIIVTLAEGTLFGMLGALLGVPATVAASITVEELKAAREQQHPSGGGLTPDPVAHAEKHLSADR